MLYLELEIVQIYIVRMMLIDLIVAYKLIVVGQNTWRRWDHRRHWCIRVKDDKRVHFFFQIELSILKLSLLTADI